MDVRHPWGAFVVFLTSLGFQTHPTPQGKSRKETWDYELLGGLLMDEEICMRRFSCLDKKETSLGFQRSSPPTPIGKKIEGRERERESMRERESIQQKKEIVVWFILFLVTCNSCFKSRSSREVEKMRWICKICEDLFLGPFWASWRSHHPHEEGESSDGSCWYVSFRSSQRSFFSVVCFLALHAENSLFLRDMCMLLWTSNYDHAVMNSTRLRT